MAGTVVPNLTDISLCEAVGSWTGSPNPTVQDPTVYTAKQGTYCLQSYSASAAARNARWDFGAATENWKDFAGKFLYFWLAFSMKDYTTGTGIITVRLTDGTGKNREWDIFDKTTLPHIGWIGWCIHADYGYDREDSGFNVNQVRYAGWLLANSARGKVYIYWDAWRFGTGLSIKGGISGDPAAFENFYTDELAQAYGVVDKIGGVYFVKGQIAVGSMTVDENTYFKDLNQVVIFQDIKGTPSGVYEIKGQRAGTGTGATKIFLGADGIGGSVIKASSAMKFKLTLTDLGVTEFGLHGCIIQNADTISLPPNNSNKKILSCNFIACGKLIADTCVVNECKFISSVGDAVLINNDPHYVTGCDFISCTRGVEIDAVGDGSYEFDALTFSDTGWPHVNNTSGSTLIVANGNGSNASTYTGSTVNFTGSIQLTITVKDEQTPPQPIVGAFAYIDDQDQEPYIMNTTTGSDGKATVGYTGAPVTNARWRVRKYGYKNFKQLIDIGSISIDLPVTLAVDPQQQ